MRIVLITPHFPPSTRGNAITVARLAHGLSEAGHEVEVRSQAGQLLRSAGGKGADVVHGFHALTSGPAAIETALRLGCPCAVTMTGTDFNEDLRRPETAVVVRAVLEQASAVVSFTHPCALELSEKVPSLGPRLHVIAQAPFVRGWPRPAAVPGPRCPGGFTLLHPAGIRPVKANTFALGPVERLRSRFPGLRLRYCGPVVDREYAERLFESIRQRSWVSYAGDISHESMPAMFAGGDAVLNTSNSEGGMPNALMEALWWGRPVIASDIPGNRELIEHDGTGLLFTGESSFEKCVERLLTEPGLSSRLVEGGWKLARERLSPRREVDAHLELYRGLTERARGGRAA